MKDKSVYDMIRKDVFDQLVKEDQIVITRYLKLEGYPMNHGLYGFAGWDKNKVGNNFRVFENNGRFFATWYAQFNGECLFRFVTVNSTRHSVLGGGSYPRYIIEANIDGLTRTIYLCPRGKLRTLVETAVREMNDSNCHEFVFRAWRNEFGKQEHYLDVYYHDVSLPTIDRSNLDSAKTKIMKNSNGPKVVWDDTIEEPRKYTKKEEKLLKADKVCGVVQFLKDKVIPRHRTRPEDSDYLSWFGKYAGLKLNDARTVTQLRGYYRLP